MLSKNNGWIRTKKEKAEDTDIITLNWSINPEEKELLLLFPQYTTWELLVMSQWRIQILSDFPIFIQVRERSAQLLNKEDLIFFYRCLNMCFIIRQPKFKIQISLIICLSFQISILSFIRCGCLTPTLESWYEEETRWM